MFGSWFGYRYAAVSFSPGPNVYYYIAASIFVRTGDVVIVPTASGYLPALVLGTNTYSRRTAPYPVSKTRSIICKADCETASRFLTYYRAAYSAVPRRQRPRGELKRGYWIRKEHLWSKPQYFCSRCREGFTYAPPVCPNCHAEMRRIKTDPVWIDELEFLEGD